MHTIDDPAVLERLVARLQCLRPETPRRWGSMTAGEMVCHLGDACAGILRGRSSAGAPSRSLRKYLALYTALPWPRGVRTRDEVNPRVKGTRPTEFEADRRRAVEQLCALAAAPSDQLPTRHFIFGAMTPRDWWRWGYRHTDHHLRQFGL